MFDKRNGYVYYLSNKGVSPLGVVLQDSNANVEVSGVILQPYTGSSYNAPKLDLSVALYNVFIPRRYNIDIDLIQRIYLYPSPSSPSSKPMNITITNKKFSTSRKFLQLRGETKR